MPHSWGGEGGRVTYRAGVKPSHACLSLAALAALATSCSRSGGSAGAAAPGPAPNSAPTLEVPSSFTGGPVSYGYSLATTESATLTFTAADQDGEALTWQVDVAAADATSAGLVYTLPEPGASFSVDLVAVGASAPAVASVTIRVRDAAGATAAIDVELVRSVPLALTGASPSSAFRTAPQEITLTGAPFAVQGNVGAAAHEVSFEGAAATDITVLSDDTLTCLSPADAAAGSNAVSISSQYSAAVALGSAVEMYNYPVELFGVDEALSEAAMFDVASDGPNLHVVCGDDQELVYLRSTDAGGTWSSQTLWQQSNPNLPLEDAKIAVDGLTVAITYHTAGIYLSVLCSEDGGVTFPNSAFITENGVDDLQICASGSYVYLVWQDPIQQTILATVSDDRGVNWNNGGYGGLVVAEPEGMDNFIVGCDGSDAWVVYAQVGTPLGLLPTDGLWATYTTDAGDSWAESAQAFAGEAYDVASCHDEGRVYVAFGSGDAIYAIRSEDAGQVWSQAPTLISPPGLVAVAAVVRCSGDRLVAAYVLEDPWALGVSRVQSWSSGIVDYTQVDDAAGQSASVIRDPDLTLVGNYVFVTYSMAPLATLQGGIPERIKFASSVDMGQTFLPAEDFGDHNPGTNVGQIRPRISVDGARVWMGWLDDRDGQGQIKLYQNRTEQ